MRNQAGKGFHVLAQGKGSLPAFVYCESFAAQPCMNRAGASDTWIWDGQTGMREQAAGPDSERGRQMRSI